MYDKNMKKYNFLKTSYIRKKIKEKIIKLMLIDYKIFKREKESNKTLVVTFDALGDNVVKSRAIEIVAERFGKENIHILCKSKWKSLYEIQGYKNIFIDETKWNIFYKIKLYRKLNSLNFNSIIVMNHSEIPEEATFVYSKNSYFMEKDVNYILEKEVLLLNKIFNEEFSLQDVKPNINKFFPLCKYQNLISVGIGASNEKRTLPVKNMAKILEEVRNIYPNKKIAILGSGKKQEEYYQEMIKLIGENNLLNYIDKIPLIETFQIIKDSDLFIGYDSGLLNVAFSFEKKSICLHWSKEKFVWEHPYEFICTLKGKGGEIYKDKKYGTDILNSIGIEQIKEAIDSLEIER